MPCSSRIIVFDLDETLGYFMEFGMFWDAINEYIKMKKIKITKEQQLQDLFNEALDLYPEFLRPNIIEILDYLKKQKMGKKCNKVIIYTNNQAPLEWARYIISYFEKKINYKLFGQIISAFKIAGNRVEVCRTTHMKTHTDLIRCSKIPQDSQICFLDDVYHPGMYRKNIYYINIKPYVHDLTFEDMTNRFIKSNILKIDIKDIPFFSTFIIDYMNLYNHIYISKSKEQTQTDNMISNQITKHLNIFFNKNNKKTKRLRNRKLNNKTKKIYEL